jgi:hypothetical protein
LVEHEKPATILGILTGCLYFDSDFKILRKKKYPVDRININVLVIMRTMVDTGISNRRSFDPPNTISKKK